MEQLIEQNDEAANTAEAKDGTLNKGRTCYICKNRYTLSRAQREDEIGTTYSCLCRPCAELNYTKRNQKVNMTGKFALVTGGRIKIGYELVLKLLRDGCHVITTSRFPHDAAKRYARESNYGEWGNRLQIYALDLKDIPGVYKFISHMKTKFPRLDVLVNNAAQTIRRPVAFFRHLLDDECIPRNHLPPGASHLLAPQETLNYGYYKQRCSNTAVESSASDLPTIEDVSHEISNNEINDPENEQPSTSSQQNLETVQAKRQKIDSTVVGEGPTLGGVFNVYVKSVAKSTDAQGISDSYEGENEDGKICVGSKSVTESMDVQSTSFFYTDVKAESQHITKEDEDLTQGDENQMDTDPVITCRGADNKLKGKIICQNQPGTSQQTSDTKPTCSSTSILIHATTSQNLMQNTNVPSQTQPFIFNLGDINHEASRSSKISATTSQLAHTSATGTGPEMNITLSRSFSLDPADVSTCATSSESLSTRLMRRYPLREP